LNRHKNYTCAFALEFPLQNKMNSVPRFTQAEPISNQYPLSSEYGTYKTVKARFWPGFAGKCPSNILSRIRFDRKQQG